MTRRRTYAAALATGALLLSGTAAASTATAAPAPTAAHTTADTATDARLRCGGNVFKYYKNRKPYQKLIYKNCTNHSVHRKADIARRADGPCKVVGPRGIRTLVRDVRMRNGVYIKGSRPC